MEKLLNQQPVVLPAYNDTLFRSLISVPVGFYMMLYREKENLTEAVFDLNFWIGTVFSYLTCLLLLWLINRISYRLDKRFNWRTERLMRLLYQFCFGLMALVALTFVLVTLFFYLLFGIDIRDTEYISHDFPLAVQLIVMGNLYYMAYFLWIVPPPGYVPLRVVSDFVKQQEEEQRKAEGRNGNNNGDKELFLAHTADGIEVIRQDRIASIFRQGDYTLLRTFDRETYTLEQTLVQAIKELDAYHFFKINPRCIVNYRVCKSFKPGAYGKLELQLGAPLNITEEVSRTRASDFEKWMER